MPNEKNDHKKNSEEEIEYHLVDDDIQYEEIPAEEMTEKKMSEPSGGFLRSMTPKKKLAIGSVILIILIYLTYHMISNSEQPNLEIQATEKPKQAEPVAKRIPYQPQLNQANSSSINTSTQSQVIPPNNVNTQAGSVPNSATSAATVGNAGTNVPSVIPVAAPPIASASINSQIESKIDELANANQQILSELQNNYLKKMAALSQENKVLQEQMQTLSNRLVSLEGKLNKSMVKNQEVKMATTSVDKSNYEIQAIIPGRAWLRSANGETLTVTEGDVVRGLGKVKRIDPYEGAVEIVTPDKTITLSYNSDGN